MNAFALINPNWGEPKPVLSTIAEDIDDCITKVQQCEEVRLYGGGSEYPMPHGTSNSLERLKEHGFKIQRITITI